MPPSLRIAALVVTLGLGLSACGQAARTEAVKSVYDGGLDQTAVWNGSVEACRNDQSTPVEACLIKTMIDAKAGTQAVAAATMLQTSGNPGYVSAFRREGKVGIAKVTYPFRANTNEGILLVPTTGHPITVDTPREGLKENPDYQALLKKHPGASPFAPATLSRVEPLGSGQRFIFSTPLRTCHACETVGVQEIPYDFDSNGAAIPQHLIWVRPNESPSTP